MPEWINPATWLSAETWKSVEHWVLGSGWLSTALLIWDRVQKRPKVKCMIRESLLVWGNTTFRHHADREQFTMIDFLVKFQMQNSGNVLTSVSELALLMFDDGNPIPIHPAAPGGRDPSEGTSYSIPAPEDLLIELAPQSVFRREILFQSALADSKRTAQSLTAKLVIKFVNHKQLEVDVPVLTPQQLTRAGRI